MANNYPEWLECRFNPGEMEADSLVALIADLPFNSFMEDEDYLLSYIGKSEWTDEVKKELDSICAEFGISYDVTEMEQKDWNAEWEANFSPVVVRDICTIVAPFHTDEEISGRKIVLSPKMAFGTGHHETTYGMIVKMDQLDLSGRKVLDFGSGTGVLAIFASMKGANPIDAIDIEGPAYDNMLDNFMLNEIDNIVPVLGGGEKIDPDSRYDVILANITANVIRDHLNILSSVLKHGGTILFSGFLESDLSTIRAEAGKAGLEYVDHMINGKWVIARFVKV